MSQKNAPSHPNHSDLPASFVVSTKKPSFSTLSYLRQTILVTGVAVITVLTLMFIKPEFNNKFPAGSPSLEQQIVSTGISPAPNLIAQRSVQSLRDIKSTPELAGRQQASKQQQAVTTWLAKRYRVANDAAHLFVSAAYRTAAEYKFDPLLILSVMAVESSFNPHAESHVGARGLMQVMPEIHKEKFKPLGGIKAALDPIANIQVGTQILKECVKRGGSVQAGLKMYVGAALHKTDGGYGNKVLAEYQRLKEVANGKSAIFGKNKTQVIAAITKLTEG